MDQTYKETTLNAARRMPTRGSIEERSEFLYDCMRDSHPEITWGVEVDMKRNQKTAFMWYSEQARQLLCFNLNNILFTVFAFKDKSEEQKI